MPNLELRYIKTFISETEPTYSRYLRKRKVEPDYKATRKKQANKAAEEPHIEVDKTSNKITLKVGESKESCDQHAETNTGSLFKSKSKNTEISLKKCKKKTKPVNKCDSKSNDNNEKQKNPVKKERKCGVFQNQTSNENSEICSEASFEEADSDSSVSNKKLKCYTKTDVTAVENIDNNVDSIRDVLHDPQMTDLSKCDRESTQNIAIKAEIKQEKEHGRKKTLDFIREVVKDKVKQRAVGLSNGESVSMKKIKEVVGAHNNSHEEGNQLIFESMKSGLYYVCGFCKRKFQWTGPFKKHLARHTRNEFDCKECGKQFSNYRSLMAHKFSRKKDRSFHCDICEFTTTTACLLRIHNKETHPPETFFHCHICPKIIRSRSYLNVHLKQYHNIHDGDYECEICGKVCKRKKLFAKHMKLHEQGNVSAVYTDFKCEDCGKTFRSKLHLRSHSRIHKAKKHLCDNCGKGFVTKTKLMAHCRTHTGEKPYACTKCDYRSTQQGNLRLHMKVHDKKFQEKLAQTYPSQTSSSSKTVTEYHKQLKEQDHVSDKDGESQTGVNDQANFQHSTEKALFDLRGAHKLALDASVQHKTSLDMDSSVDLDEDSESPQETATGPSDYNTDVTNELNSDPSVLYPDYFRPFTSDQYSASRSAYQDTAQQLMYLNQQRFFETSADMYENVKYSNSNPLYSGAKYSSDTSLVKNTGASSEPYGNTTKSDTSTQGLVLSPDGHILRQMITATGNMYSGSNTAANFIPNQHYPGPENTYGVPHSAMYTQSEKTELDETSIDKTAVSQKQQNLNTGMNTESSTTISTYTAVPLDIYTANHGDDFSSHLPVTNIQFGQSSQRISSEPLVAFSDGKEQVSLYHQTAGSALTLVENGSSVFPHTGQEYSYVATEHSSSALRKVS